MNEYIFYTTEGYTTAPNENFEVENCQLIGIASGESKKDALAVLFEENPWIIPAGFDPIFFICRQLASPKPPESEPPLPAPMYGAPLVMCSPREQAEKSLDKSEVRKYKVEIQETLTKVVEVEAANESEAVDKVSDQYMHSEMVLETGDLEDYTIRVI